MYTCPDKPIHIFMRYLLLLALGISIIFPTMAQERVNMHSNTYIQWKNKSKMGISINYDYRKYDHKYSVFSIMGYIPARVNIPDGTAQEWGSFEGDYKIEEHTTNTIRLQADYWIFPFLNLYALGGKIYDHGKINVRLQANKIDLPPFSQEINTDGWIYGGGAKSELIYRNFKPKIEYTIYWNHYDDISNKSLFQALTFSLGYIVPVNKTWIKNINIYAGGSYNHIKFENHYGVYYDEYTLQQIFDEVQQPGEKPLNNLSGALDIISFKNIHDWNMTTGFEIELCHHFHYKLEAVFLGKETTVSTGITYRLFGKKN